ASSPVDGTFVDARRFHPAPAAGGSALQQLYGDVWQWTKGPYVAYPGYAPSAGALGEYNGKWMCDQWVLRGASCATPRSHARITYRNFFPSDARWQFMGVRLARNALAPRCIRSARRMGRVRSSRARSSPTCSTAS